MKSDSLPAPVVDLAPAESNVSLQSNSEFDSRCEKTRFRIYDILDTLAVSQAWCCFELSVLCDVSGFTKSLNRKHALGVVGLELCSKASTKWTIAATLSNGLH